MGKKNEGYALLQMFDMLLKNSNLTPEKQHGREPMSKYYPSWEEARRAIARLTIAGADEYMRRYKEDPLLPPNPYDIYPEGRLHRLFNSGRRRDVYATWQEASAATISLGIKLYKDYWKKYHADPKLPSHPSNIYADFPGWGTFFGTGTFHRPRRTIRMYDSWNEAALATRSLGILTKPQYHLRYKEDPKLPRHPESKYKEDWVGWRPFLGTDFRRRRPRSV